MRAHRSLIKLAAAWVLPLAAACGVQVDLEQSTEPVPVPEVEAASELASSGEIEAPSQAVPSTSVPSVSVPTTSVLSVSSPTGSAPEIDHESSEGETTSVQGVDVTTATARPTDADGSATSTTAPLVGTGAHDPATSADAEAPGSVSVPATSVPPVSVPEFGPTTSEQPLVAESEEPAVSSLSILSVSLVIAPELSEGYDRDEWGPHDSDLCRGEVGSPDPYTGKQIDTCDVDHVVALQEAHASGGWRWLTEMKEQFSQDPDNHVATRACVNRSKGSADISEWFDAESSSACGGYAVTSAGRCFLARTTVIIKSEWGLSVDQAEADTLTAILAECSEPAEANG